MLKETFFRQFLHNLQSRLQVHEGEQCILAVSGGLDSIVLLDLMHKAQSAMPLRLAVAHVNHNLRGNESVEDRDFVEELANRYSLPFYQLSVYTKEIACSRNSSIQETARDLRYNFFYTLRAKLGFSKIATAHNANDNAETVLFNFIRGTGLKGLAGIPLERSDEGIIRPLLFATREQIANYAVENNLRHREDSSNAKTIYSRNFLRHDVFPLLKEHINNNVIETMNRNAELFSMAETYIAGQLQRTLQELLRQDDTDRYVIDRNKFLAQHSFMQYSIIHTLGKTISGAEISFDTIKEMLSIVNSDTGAWCGFGQRCKLYRNRDELVFLSGIEEHGFQCSLSPGESVQSQTFVLSTSFVSKANFTLDPNIEFVDAGKLGSSFLLRTWKNGDWFIPLGMSNKKKLSDYFIEEKIPVFSKHSIPLLLSGESIVWVCGKRLDERFKVTSSTTSILKLEFTPKHE